MAGADCSTAPVVKQPNQDLQITVQVKMGCSRETTDLKVDIKQTGIHMDVVGKWCGKTSTDQ